MYKSDNRLIQAVLSSDIFLSVISFSNIHKWRSILFQTFIVVGIVYMFFSVLCFIACHGVMGVEPAIENK